MAVEVKVPPVGESITEVALGQWMKKDGDRVEKDEAIAELETDKTNVEVTAPEAGILRRAAKEGQSLSIGDLVATIEPAGASAAAPATSARKQDPEEEESGKPAQADQTKKTAAGAAKPSPSDSNGGKASPESRKATSVARKIAEEHGVDLTSLEGHGPAGRITRDDVIAHVAESKKQSAAPSTPPAPTGPAPAPPKPSQPGDVADEVAPAQVGKVSATRGTSRERMSTLRRKIAQRLVEAQHNAAMLTTFNEADMTAVMDIRARYKESFQKKYGIGLGFMSFFVKAVIEGLKANPRLNAYIEGDEIVHHHYYDIGVAVGTERGLVVPVIRNAELLTFAGIEQRIRDFGERAKAGRLSVEELSGGTFTISNGGVYGSMMSTPILNPPQSGILGMHNIIRRPIAIGDEIKIRPMMYLALSYDHRIVDGKEAVGFLVRVKECIEAPERLLVEV